MEAGHLVGASMIMAMNKGETLPTATDGTI